MMTGLALALGFVGSMNVDGAAIDAAPSAGRLFSEKWLADRVSTLEALASRNTGHRFTPIRSKSGAIMALYYSFPIESRDGCKASDAELTTLANIGAAVIPYYSKGIWRSTNTYPQPEIILLVHGAEAHRADPERAKCDANVAEQLASVPAYMQTEMHIGQAIDLFTWKQFIPPIRVDVDYGLAFGPASMDRSQTWQINPDVAKPRLHKVLAGALDGMAPVAEGEHAAAANRRVEVWMGGKAEELVSIVRRSSALDADYTGIATKCNEPSEWGYCGGSEVARGRLDRLQIAPLIFQPQVTVRSEIGQFVMGHKYDRDD
jgi:hypothetical protein